jgi:integrase
MSFDTPRRSNGIYMVVFTGNGGKRVRLSTGKRDEAAAKLKARELYLEHYTGPPPAIKAPPKGFTLSQAFDRMFLREWHPTRIKTSAAIRSDCDQIIAHIGDTLVADVSYRVLEGYADTCANAGHAVGTILKRIGRVTSTLKMCCVWEDASGMPYLKAMPVVPRLGAANVRKRCLSEPEEASVRAIIEQFMCGARPTNRPGILWAEFSNLVIWLIDTGMRKNEALGLLLTDVVDGVAYLRDTKNGEERGVPLTTRCTKVLSSQSHSGAPKMFPSLTESRVFEMWDEVRIVAGLEDVVIHDLRRTRGSRLAQAGVPLDQVARLLGHKDPSITFKTYQHLQPADLRRWVEQAERTNA